MKGLVVDFPRSPSPVIEWESEDELENNIVERNKSSSKGGNVADHTTTLVHSVLKGGGSEKCFFPRKPKVCFGQLGQVIECSTLRSTFQ